MLHINAMKLEEFGLIERNTQLKGLGTLISVQFSFFLFLPLCYHMLFFFTAWTHCSYYGISHQRMIQKKHVNMLKTLHQGYPRPVLDSPYFLDVSLLKYT